MMDNPFNLIGKNILITGASSGIGRQTAIACSRMGARIALFGRDLVRLEETISKMEDASFHRKFVIDITDVASLEKVMTEASEIFGNFHGIVHSAGISTTLPVKLISPEKQEHFFKTNVMAAIHLSKLFCKPGLVSKEGGSIVFIASVMGVVGESGKTLYSLTKGALLAGSKSMALELAPKKIRVNVVSPGVVVTPMSQNAVYSQDEDSRQKMINLHPLGLGSPVDVANACIYLLSDASRWVTGTNLIIDGGYTAR